MMITIDKIIRSRRKTICLQVTRDARVVMRVPYGFAKERIDAIIQRKHDWILRKVAFVRTIDTMSLRSRLASGAGLPFLGETYPVRAQESEGSLRFECGFYLCAARFHQAEVLLKDWYRAKAAEIITENLRALRVRMDNIPLPKRVSIGNGKLRLGSCDSKGNIIFSWRLAAAPAAVIDYVLAHEMAHLVHLNHSENFWKFVGLLYPGYKGSRSWLKKNSHLLML